MRSSLCRAAIAVAGISSGTGAAMIDAEFRAFVARARAEIEAELHRLDALDWVTMRPEQRATLGALRTGYIELSNSMADDVAAGLQSTEYRGAGPVAK